jgi:hypothetical protein
VQLGGSARGYQETLRTVDGLDCGRGLAVSPYIYTALRLARTSASAAFRASAWVSRAGAGAVLVAVPGGSVADVLGAMTGIESKAVIDGTSLSGAMSLDRFVSTSAHQGARRSQRQKSASWLAVPILGALDWPATNSSPALGDDRRGPALASIRA